MSPPSRDVAAAAPGPVQLDQSGAGTRGVSEQLRAFTEQMPYERRSILAFVQRVARALPAGATVLDVGAGNAPYRELFDHCEYVTTDWTQSVHERSRAVDMVAPADALPVADATVDAVLLTQVLEHVRTPGAVLAEAARVLRDTGMVGLTVPFVWELHELPHDYWRFTPASLELLLAETGFAEAVVEPRNDCFSTIAQLLHNLRSAMGRATDGRDAERNAASDLLGDLAARIAALAPLDVNAILPLGWAATARRSTRPPQ